VNDITTTDIKFYDRNNSDYRLEVESLASIENNGLGETIGAIELEKPSTFYTNLSEAQVQSGVNFKQLSRTNNKTGSLVGGGETDPNKVLNTSTEISGLI